VRGGGHRGEISGPARDVLAKEGFGWSDWRSHMRDRTSGLVIDADAAAGRPAVPRLGFRQGRTGVGATVALMAAASLPERDPWASVAPAASEIADVAGFAVSGASAATSRLAHPVAPEPMKLRAAEAPPGTNAKKQAIESLDAYTRAVGRVVGSVAGCPATGATGQRCRARLRPRVWR